MVPDLLPRTPKVLDLGLNDVSHPPLYMLLGVIFRNVFLSARRCSLSPLQAQKISEPDLSILQLLHDLEAFSFGISTRLTCWPAGQIIEIDLSASF